MKKRISQEMKLAKGRKWIPFLFLLSIMCSGLQTNATNQIPDGGTGTNSGGGTLYNFNVDNLGVGQNNYEVVLAGDYSSLNSFYTPSGWNVSTSYNPITNETTIHYYGPPISGPGQTHFGFGPYNRQHYELRRYWSQSSIYAGCPVAGSVRWIHDFLTHISIHTFHNVSLDTIIVNTVGYRIFPNTQPLSTLNEAGMPSASFISSGVAPNTILNPGDSVIFEIAGLDVTANPNLFVVIYQSTQFANPSTSPYTGSVQTWTGGSVAVPTLSCQPGIIPTLSQWGLIIFGVVLLGVGAAYIVRRRKAGIPV